jgi:hypothetical protein
MKRAIQIDGLAQRYGTRPSDLAGIDPELTVIRYIFDLYTALIAVEKED